MTKVICWLTSLCEYAFKANASTSVWIIQISQSWIPIYQIMYLQMRIDTLFGQSFVCKTIPAKLSRLGTPALLKKSPMAACIWELSLKTPCPARKTSKRASR